MARLGKLQGQHRDNQLRDCCERIAGKDYLAIVMGSQNTDTTTNAVKTIDYPHNEIHGGSAFVCRSFVDIDITKFYDIQVTTPNTTKWAHMTFEFEVESETIFWVYENVTINVAGTALGCGNRNRNSATATGLVIKGIANDDLADANADTAVAGATLLATGTLGAGRREGGTSHSEQEVILKQNEDYTVRFQATAAGYVNYKLDYYEHTNA